MAPRDSVRAMDKARLVDHLENSSLNAQTHTEKSVSQINPELIRKKQKHIFLFKVLGVSALVCIPIVINALSRTHQATWPTTLSVMALGFLAFLLYRGQTRLRFQIESACHQLGPGVKLRRKYLKGSQDLYQIFQEGHRYYYIRSLETGEKRLVPKEKILQDYDLAL